MLSLPFFKPVSLNVRQLTRCSENQYSVTSYGCFLKHLNWVFCGVWLIYVLSFFQLPLFYMSYAENNV